MDSYLGSFFLGAYTDLTVSKYVWVQHCDDSFSWSHQFMFITGYSFIFVLFVVILW